MRLDPVNVDRLRLYQKRSAPHYRADPEGFKRRHAIGLAIKRMVAIRPYMLQRSKKTAQESTTTRNTQP